MERLRGSWQFLIQHWSDPNATNFDALSGCARHFLLHIRNTIKCLTDFRRRIVKFGD